MADSLPTTSYKMSRSEKAFINKRIREQVEAAEGGINWVPPPSERSKLPYSHLREVVVPAAAQQYMETDEGKELVDFYARKLIKENRKKEREAVRQAREKEKQQEEEEREQGIEPCCDEDGPDIIEGVSQRSRGEYEAKTKQGWEDFSKGARNFAEKNLHLIRKDWEERKQEEVRSLQQRIIAAKEHHACSCSNIVQPR